jgi:large subunit ribosomal protein L4
MTELTERSTTVTVVSASGATGETVDLPAEIFGAKVNVPLIHQVVVAQQAAARQGTHATRNRGAVRGGGKKPYRQKGTGRARQGSIRAPQFTGGGVVHGPVPRSYEQRTPKKMKAAALRGALSDRAAHGRVHVVSGFTEGDEPRTKDALAVLSSVTGAAPSAAAVLVVAGAGDAVTWKSLRNVPGVHLLDPGQLNTYDVLVSDHVVFTAAALDQFLARSGLPGVVQQAPAGPGEPAGSGEPADSGETGETPTRLPDPLHSEDAAS